MTVSVETSDVQTILIVDHDKQSRDSLSDLVESLGYNIIEAPGSQQALAKVRADSKGLITILITEYEMPEINGITLANQIQKERADIHIIFVTEKANETDFIIKLDVGLRFWPRVMKPATKQAIEQAINQKG